MRARAPAMDCRRDVGTSMEAEEDRDDGGGECDGESEDGSDDEGEDEGQDDEAGQDDEDYDENGKGAMRI